MQFFAIVAFSISLTPAIKADAPLRRPISPEQPAWLVHIDNWNNADPQKIIDLIPEDIKPYVIFNISMSISHDEDTGEMLKVPYGYSTALTWLRTCAENNVWAMVQCSSGGYSHFSETDMRIYEEFYRDFPNFVGWNYAEQFWGFDNQFSCTFDERLTHFADLMKLARKYGGYTCISFCGNVWSRALSPLAMMKRSKAFAAQCAEAPQNLIILDKYTMSSMFYEYESMNYGSFIAGYTTNYGIRFDQCGWNAELESESENMPAAAGIAPVLNNWMLTGGTVNDGPELIWQQCFNTKGTKTLSDGYTTRVFEMFPQFVNVSIDLYRKLLDGTVGIMTREETVERQKLVIVNDVNSDDEQMTYGAPDDLYDGLYNMKDGETVMNNKNWFKKTGRYPTIPIVPTLVDSLAKSMPVQILRSKLSSRWSSISKKQQEMNQLFPSEYSGNAFAARVENGWLVYNPFKDGSSAWAEIPLQYSSCDTLKLNLSQYSAGIVKEFPDSIHIYLNNYRTDVTALKTDAITITGCSAEPEFSWKDRANHSKSKIESTVYDSLGYTVKLAHNGAVDLFFKCSGDAIDRKAVPESRSLTEPAAPTPYYGPVTHECEDFDYRNTNSFKIETWNRGTKNFSGLGYMDFGTNSGAVIRDTYKIPVSGEYNVILRYSTPNSNGKVKLEIGGKSYSLTLSKTGNSKWSENVISGVSLNAGEATVLIKSRSNSTTLYLDRLTIVPADYREPRSMTVSRYFLEDLSADKNSSEPLSVILNARSLESPVQIVTTEGFVVSDAADGYFSDTLMVEPDSLGHILDLPVWIAIDPEAAIGSLSGSVIFSADSCQSHVLPLNGIMNPIPVSLSYDFEADEATKSYSRPPAIDVSVPTGGKSRAGVYKLKGNDLTSNVLKIYKGGGNNGSGALELERFTTESTDYSVTWKQYNTTTDDYKVGMLLRGGKIVGTDYAGYSQGFREGYVFIVYNHRSSGNSEFRIYKSTKSTSLSMLTNKSASLNPGQNQPVWYRASVSGSSSVQLTFEYSTDGKNWQQATSYTDVDASFQQGATQIVWGLAAAESGFCMDDIAFEGITYNEDVNTAVEVIRTDDAPTHTGGAIYDTSGRQLQEPAKKGIYIDEGKTIFAR